jgi:hypothetical protein
MMMMLNCMAIATMCLQGSSTAQDFVPEGIEILTKGVRFAEINPGDLIGASHCSALLSRAEVEHGYLDSPYRPYLQSSGPSHIVAFEADLARALTALRAYAASGHVKLFDQEKVVTATGYKTVSVNPGDIDKSRAALITEVTSDFAENVGNYYGLEIRGIALRQRKYFRAAEDQVLSVGYDALVTAYETANFATSVYHIQCLADLSLTNWNRVKTFVTGLTPKTRVETAVSMKTAASPITENSFVPQGIPNILEGRLPVVHVGFFDSISKRHIESILEAANIDAVESTSVRTSYYVRAEVEEMARKHLIAEGSIREYVDFPGDYGVGIMSRRLARPNAVLSAEKTKQHSDLREIDELLRWRFQEVAPASAEITRIRYRKRHYLVSPKVKGIGYECSVEYKSSDGQLYELKCQVLADLSVRWAMPTSIGR